MAEHEKASECNETKGDRSGLKAFGVIATLAVLISGMAAIVRPIQQQMEGLQALIVGVNTELRSHSKENNHPWGVLAEIATLRQRFVEVETQFRGLREISDLKSTVNKTQIAKLEEWQSWWYRNIPPLDADQNGRIVALEREIATLRVKGSN